MARLSRPSCRPEPVTPPSGAGSAAGTPGATTQYPLTQQFSIEFSPYEDRLILTAERGGSEPARLLLTRRMVMILLRQVLQVLPRMMGLSQTPAAYWQEVLGMAHQQAMAAKQSAQPRMSPAAGNLAIPPAAPATYPVAPAPSPAAELGASPLIPPRYLATELTLQQRDGRLLLAFKGLPLPEAMTTPCPHEPVLAVSLTLDHIHQLLSLLIRKCEAAQWHLPLNLPWLKTQQPDTTQPALTSKLH